MPAITPATTSYRHRYDALTQSLHWLIALGVIAAYGIGLVREELPKGDFRTLLLSLHMSIGLLIMGLSVVRIGWRAASPSPARIAMPRHMELGAKAAHLLLYVTMLAIPLLGLFAAFAKGRTIGFFGLFPVPSPIAIDRGLAEVLEETHEVASHTMMLLAGAHAAAAIYHQWVMKDGTLGRMLPFTSAPPATAAE